MKPLRVEGQLLLLSIISWLLLSIIMFTNTLLFYHFSKVEDSSIRLCFFESADISRRQ